MDHVGQDIAASARPAAAGNGGMRLGSASRALPSLRSGHAHDAPANKRSGRIRFDKRWRSWRDSNTRPFGPQPNALIH